MKNENKIYYSLDLFFLVPKKRYKTYKTNNL